MPQRPPSSHDLIRALHEAANCPSDDDRAWQQARAQLERATKRFAAASAGVEKRRTGEPRARPAKQRGGQRRRRRARKK